MCGIAGVYVKEPYIGRVDLNNFVDHLFRGIEARGKDATGYIAVKPDNGYRVVKNNIKATDFIKSRPRIDDDTKMILMHTRLATQGKPEQMENNHPVLFDTCFVTHNGIIRNDAQVFRTLECERPADVDSVAIPAMLTHHGMGNVEDAKIALNKVQGMLAIAACDPVRHPGKLLLAKGASSPLWVVNHKKMIVWASLKSTIDNAWARSFGTPPTRKGTKENGRNGIYELKWGEMWMIENDQIEEATFISGTGGQSYSSYNFLDDEWESYGEGGSFYSTVRKWTCVSAQGTKNAFSNCIHPCDPGCQTARCWCYEGCARHPKVNGADPTAGMQTMPGNNTARRLHLLPGGSGGGDSVNEAPKCNDGVAHSACEGCYFRYCPKPKLPIREPGNQTEIEILTGEVIMQCDGCEHHFGTEDLNEFRFTGVNTDYLLCDDCFQEEDMQELNDPLLRRHEKKSTRYEEVARRENLIHQRALLEVAYECDSTVAFIDWILFRCPFEDLEDDQNLADLREEIENEYENAVDIATKLVEEAELRDGR